MIGFFPQPYEDELLYSWIARYAERACCFDYTSVARDLFVNPHVVPSIELLNNMTSDLRNILGSMENIVLNHTMFPYYARFIPQERRIKAFQTLSNMTDDNKADLVPLPLKRKRRKRYLRYCPICMKEQLKQFYEPYFKRQHQMYGVFVCPIHHCLLIDSSIEITSYNGPILKAAREVVEKVKPTQLDDFDINVRIADYVYSVFNAPLDLYSTVPIGRFIHSKMAHTKYRSARGEQRNLTLMSKDMNDYYMDLIQNQMTDYWNITKVLGGRRCGTFDICMIGMFLGIPPQELANPIFVEDNQQQEYDDKIRQLKNQRLNYRQIADEIGGSYHYVKFIGEKMDIDENC